MIFERALVEEKRTQRERERVTNRNTRNKTEHPPICIALVCEGMKTGRAKTDFIECVGDEGQPKFLFAGNRWSYKINLNKYTQIILDLFAAS